ncbi:MAG TPA: hypothetical protein VFA94_11520 [Acidimicrobiales bacterium]|nr:hypothetical protein [Acidimicrobiales bacterium]
MRTAPDDFDQEELESLLEPEEIATDTMLYVVEWQAPPDEDAGDGVWEEYLPDRS